TQRATNSHTRTIRSELHPERLHARIRRRIDRTPRIQVSRNQRRLAGHLVPQAEALAPPISIGQLAPKPKHRLSRSAVRVGRIRDPPLLAVVGLGRILGAKLDPRS